jgi:hypothetical protein
MTHLVISCNDHSIEIVESQELGLGCRKLFCGTYLECEQWKTDFIEDSGYVGAIFNNTKK